MIRVLVVDDSETMRLIMRKALMADPEFEVAAEAGSGQEALAAVHRHQPDVVTMDILMPGMNGLDATRRIMEESPRPIVMVSAVGDRDEQRISFEAMASGAVWLVRKPRGSATADWSAWSRSFRDVVKSMSAVKVVRRRAQNHAAPAAAPSRAAAPVSAPTSTAAKSALHPGLVAIAASTGGPTALQPLLSALPADYPVPVLICQHIADGFVEGLAEWLQYQVKLPVRVAEGPAPLQTGITLAPDGANLVLAGRELVDVRPPDGTDRYVPSGDRLLGSVAQARGKEAVGIVLTGMGQDGAEGLKAMREAGALTIAQDEASSLIYGMPRAAWEAGAAKHEMSLEQISDLLLALQFHSEKR